jgi:hypothetical protein
MRSTDIDRRARAFTDVANAFLELVEMLDPSQWQAPSIEDGRPIGTIAHHVALGFAIGHWRVIAAGSGYPQPLQQGTAAERNAAHAFGTPAPARDTTLRLLRAGMTALEAAIRSLRSDQLGTALTIGPVTTTIGGLVDEASRHVLEHDATIRRSIGLGCPH